jgi:hypothetical protein
MSAGALDMDPDVGMSGVLAVLYFRSSEVLQGCISGCVSKRKKYAVIIEASSINAQMRFGRR